MKTLATLFLATVLSGSLGGFAMATEYTKGTVKKVDMKAKKVTIAHEELKGLDMPAMTMVFHMADDAMLEKVKVGQPIEFAADRVNGSLTVTEIKE